MKQEVNTNAAMELDNLPKQERVFRKTPGQQEGVVFVKKKPPTNFVAAGFFGGGAPGNAVAGETHEEHRDAKKKQDKIQMNE